MFRFEQLDVWKLSIQYGKSVYKVAGTFPRNEVFGLTSQIKRASLSISSNIAEGSGSATVNDFRNFLDIAIKSTLETVSQLRFAKEMDYIDDVSLQDLYEEAERLIRKMRRLKESLRSRRAISDSRRAATR